jgi:hypothetical protein
MPAVIRLVTVADVREVADPREMSVAARHEAVLDDGRWVLLLDDRGWSAGLRGAGAGAEADIWQFTSEREIAETARVVVGPDEAFGGRTQRDMERDHWSWLAEKLGAQGVVVDADGLKELPHEVILSERLRERLSRGRRTGT